MSMKAFDELKMMLCDELEEIVKKGELSAGDLETAHKLTDTIKNICKIYMLDEESEMSGGSWRADGSYSRGNGRYGNSYGGSYNSGYSGRRHYVRGHYSRAGGRYGMSNGGYSMAEGKEMISDQIQELMENPEINDNDRRTLEEALSKLNR